MFCNNCGNQLEDGAVFCQNCGSSVEVEETQQEQVQEEQVVQEEQPEEWGVPQWEPPVQPANMDKKKIGIAVAAVAVIVLLICILGGGGYKKAAKSYIKAIEKSNAKQLLKLTMPKKAQKEEFDDKDDKKDWIEDTEDYLDEMWEYFDDNDMKVTFEIKEYENLKKLDDLEEDVEDQYGIEDLKDFRDYMEDDFDDCDMKVKHIKAAYAVEVKAKMKGDEETSSETMILIVYKYKGDWFVYGDLF